MNNQLIKILTLSFLFLFHHTLDAATIKQVKNGKALLVLDGETLNVGDQLFGVNSFNKKTSLMQVTTIKGNQAVAKILKGSAQPNDKTELRTATGSEASVPRPAAKTTYFRQDMIKVALNLKVTQDSITSKQQDSLNNLENVSMTGTNFGVVGTLDYPLYPWLSLRAYTGYEMYKVVGTAQFFSCGDKSTKNCNVEINYFSLGGLVRFNYTLTSLQLWAGIGGSLRQPLTKETTALKKENIAIANTALVALGADYHLSNKYYIPASVEYHYSFNTSDSVPTISQLALLVGFGILF